MDIKSWATVPHMELLFKCCYIQIKVLQTHIQAVTSCFVLMRVALQWGVLSEEPLQTEHDRDGDEYCSIC